MSRTDEDAAVPFAELPRLYGVTKNTLHVWIKRGKFPADLIHDADATNPKYVNYEHAWVPRRAALHWGRLHGQLHRDGTPNNYSATSTGKRFEGRGTEDG